MYTAKQCKVIEHRSKQRKIIECNNKYNCIQQCKVTEYRSKQRYVHMSSIDWHNCKFGN